MPTYRDVFFAANGFGPYPCYFCGKEVTFDEVFVHHIDEIPSRNANHHQDNVTAAHGSCHASYHKKSWYAKLTIEEKAAIAAKIPTEAAERGRRKTHEKKLPDGRSVTAVKAGTAGMAKRTAKEKSALGRKAAKARWDRAEAST